MSPRFCPGRRSPRRASSRDVPTSAPVRTLRSLCLRIRRAHAADQGLETSWRREPDLTSPGRALRRSGAVCPRRFRRAGVGPRGGRGRPATVRPRRLRRGAVRPGGVGAGRVRRGRGCTRRRKRQRQCQSGERDRLPGRVLRTRSRAEWSHGSHLSKLRADRRELPRPLDRRLRFAGSPPSGVEPSSKRGSQPCYEPQRLSASPWRGDSSSPPALPILHRVGAAARRDPCVANAIAVVLLLHELRVLHGRLRAAARRLEDVRQKGRSSVGSPHALVATCGGCGVCLVVPSLERQSGVRDPSKASAAGRRGARLGLSRRRSRVRVPSLPPSEVPTPVRTFRDDPVMTEPTRRER